jgi:hypothetical protein
MKYARLREGPPKPKGTIQNLENFAPEFMKWGLEYAVFCFMDERMKFIRFK